MNLVKEPAFGVVGSRNEIGSRYQIVAGKLARALQGFGERAARDEFQLVGGLLSGLPPDEPLLRAREHARQRASGGGGFDLTGEPGVRLQNVRGRPDARAGCDGGAGARQAQCLGALTRGHDEGIGRAAVVR